MRRTAEDAGSRQEHGPVSIFALAGYDTAGDVAAVVFRQGVAAVGGKLVVIPAEIIFRRCLAPCEVGAVVLRLLRAYVARGPLHLKAEVNVFMAVVRVNHSLLCFLI